MVSSSHARFGSLTAVNVNRNTRQQLSFYCHTSMMTVVAVALFSPLFVVITHFDTVHCDESLGSFRIGLKRDPIGTSRNKTSDNFNRVIHEQSADTWLKSLKNSIPNRLLNVEYGHPRRHRHNIPEQMDFAVNYKTAFVSRRQKKRHRLLKSGAHIDSKQISSSHYNQNVPTSAKQYYNQTILDRKSTKRESRFENRSNQSKKRHNRHHMQETKKRPNIIFLLTDDQDIELGSMNYMPKTMKILSKGGVHIKNAYVTTPICCPSRSSILTGLYTHNHNIHTNGQNCSSLQWQKTHERQTFATYLRDVGYRTAFFGKYLNEYNGSYIPPGWRDWSALVRNSRYYNYTLNVNGDKVRHGFNYESDYYPDLILNDSLQYMKYSKRLFPNKPYLMMLSFPSPHGPEDSAPQYHNLFLNEKQHRTPSWNFAPNLDKQWILRNTPKMAPIHQEFTDLLNIKRLQTLQSVDEAVSQIYQELKSLGELENTYIIYTSDHGYHLGQFGLVKGKAMPFEFDIKVPFFVRGPNIPPNKTLQQIVLNIDIAPTILDIAGVQVPSHMDGVSFLPLLKDIDKPKSGKGRDSFLIERGQFKAQHGSMERLLIPILGKKEWLKMECQKPDYQSPCRPYQKFECYQDESKTFRIRKCQRRLIDLRFKNNSHCVCPPKDNETELTFSSENDVLRQFKHAHKHRQRKYSKNLYFQNNFSRKRRSDPFESYFNDEMLNSEFDVNGVFELKKLIDVAKAPDKLPTEPNLKNQITWNNLANISTDQLLSLINPLVVTNSTSYINKTFCKVSSNNINTECLEQIYSNQSEWREKRNLINTAIKKLQNKLFELKGIRRFINEKKPKVEKAKSTEELCKCDETSDNDDMGRRQLHPRRHLERRLMRKDLTLKKWLRRQKKKHRKKEKFQNTTCEMAVKEQMNCFTHDNDHWKTPLFWTKGPFCFCQNSLNNSFWCLRTINETHNFLFCEFVTGFIAYFDLYKDPYQLQNAIYDLEFCVIEEMSRKLAQLKVCSGSAQCSNMKPRRLNTNSITTRSMDFRKLY